MQCVCECVFACSGNLSGEATERKMKDGNEAEERHLSGENVQ